MRNFIPDQTCINTNIPSSGWFDCDSRSRAYTRKKKNSLFEEQRVVYMIRNYLLLKLSLERTAAA